ncbi:MAG: DinB family protein [Lunatimonas sp.]|uniref:DinB family protein n=1 Tax=Lunatimonas sp. TaxID=2060141 RepID=UPI00263AF6BD|nr:DinB family protein [Lunatimonas sp.]MCC5936305.1 DinB family protein [Lunatimonas sp.]
MQNKPTSPNLEVWQRGPVEGVPPLLQPVAHALLQTVEEANKYLQDVDDRLLWERPAGMASVGFHMQHMAGVVDRLFTYANGQPLREEQLAYLKLEGTTRMGFETVTDHIRHLEWQVGAAVDVLRQVDENQLTDARFLGRQRIPTTQIGLFVHTAEHLQRHVGQLLVTVKWVQSIN